MATIRVARRRRFVIVDQAAIEDERLSFRARGLLTFLLAKPDDWTVDSESLAGTAKEGRDAVRTALRELEACGYLKREKAQVEGGKWVTVTTLYEVPEDGFPGVGEPGVGFPGAKDLNTQTEDKTPTGSASPVVRRDVEIAKKHLEPLIVKLQRGGSFDLTALIRDLWTEAWQEADTAGIDPNSVGIQIAAFLFQYVTDEAPNFPKIGTLVKRYGKLAVFGLDEAMGHADDPYRYAFRRCQQAAQEHEMTTRRGA